MKPPKGGFFVPEIPPFLTTNLIFQPGTGTTLTWLSGDKLSNVQDMNWFLSEK
ncbi:TPA: hypothetical protein JG837_003886 [Enterobacter hormaechei subsp. steigerwaltii]|nr:hypothetical protein [Enterobacter hormaechei subsp. steigerwaltii]